MEYPALFYQLFFIPLYLLDSSTICIALVGTEFMNRFFLMDTPFYYVITWQVGSLVYRKYLLEREHPYLPDLCTED
jgi:hypothetical protein